MKITLGRLSICIGLMFVSNAHAQSCSFTAQASPPGKAQALAQEAGKTNPCTTVPGLTAKSLNSVWTAFLSSGTTGGKRFETVPPFGSPTGKVLAESQGVPFDLRGVMADGVVSLLVSSAGVNIFSVNNPTQTGVIIPMSRLKPGNRYDWVLATRKASYRASFELPDAEEAALIQSRLDLISKSQLSPDLRMLYTAAVYDDADMYVARDQVLAQLRAQLTPQ